MPFNGSGVFQRVRNWVADATAGIKIRADYHDSEDDNFATGLTNCITKDGQTTITQNIPFNSKRITGLEDPVNPQDAATMAWAMPKSGGTITGELKVTGDIYVGYGTTQGTIRFDNDPNHYLYWDGSNFTFSDRLIVPDLVVNSVATIGNGIEVGPTAGTPGIGYIDFHSGVPASDYEARIYVTGGTGSLIFDTKGARSIFGGPLAVGAPTLGSDAATMAYVDGRTSFTPVQQGGGAGQLTNKVYIGWDGSGLKAQVDGVDQGRFIFGSSAVISARLAYAGDVAAATGPQSSPYEPYAGGVLTGWQWAIVGTSTVTSFRIRYMQVFTTSWFTIGYTA